MNTCWMLWKDRGSSLIKMLSTEKKKSKKKMKIWKMLHYTATQCVLRVSLCFKDIKTGHGREAIMDAIFHERWSGKPITMSLLKEKASALASRTHWCMDKGTFISNAMLTTFKILLNLINYLIKRATTKWVPIVMTVKAFLEWLGHRSFPNQEENELMEAAFQNR